MLIFVLLFFLTSPIFVSANSIMYQSNLERTGVYDDAGPEKEPILAWKFDAGAPVVGTVLVDEGVAYFSDFDGGVYAAYATDGSLAWEKNLGGQPSFQMALSEDLILVGRRFSRDDEASYLVALDRISGEERWRFEPDDLSGMDAPTIYEGKVFLTSMSEHLFALDLETGNELWRRSIQGGSRQPLISDGMLFIQDNAQSIYAFQAETGEILWSLSSLSDKENSFSTPVIDDCCIYATVVRRDESSILKINKENGRQEDSFVIESPTMASLSLDDDVIYYGDYALGDGRSGYMNALSTITGELQWRFETAGSINSAVAIAGDVIYFGSHDHHLYAIDRHSGELKWRYETDAGIASAPAVVDGRVYFGSIDGHVYVLE